MADFSMEIAAESIYDPRTKDNFGEVQNSYINGNYRSSVVMLWSVAVCDLIYKLQLADNLYGDVVSQGILQEIVRLQSANPNSPDWEIALIELVKERTSFFDTADVQNLISLQKHRHLSAHPVLSNNYELYRPNKETTRAHIRNVLEGVLVKPPILTRRIFDHFVEDLAQVKELLLDDASLRRYLEAKYLRNMKPDVEGALFKGLWKLSFRTSNDDCNNHRDINYRALRMLYNRNAHGMRNIIEREKDYFSNVSSERAILECLFDFMRRQPHIYKLLNDAARIPILKLIESDNSCFATAWFLDDKPEERVDKVLEKAREDYSFVISAPAYASVWKVCDAVGVKEKAIALAVIMYTKSGSYDEADVRFSAFVKPYISHYDESHLHMLIQGIEDNRQCYARRGSYYDHGLIVDQCERVSSSFDYSKYHQISKIHQARLKPFNEADIQF